MKKISSFIKEYLEKRPIFYAYLRPQEAMFFYERLNKIKGPILDFGCGDGFFASTIFKKKYIDVGLDLSTSRIKEAKELRIYKSLITYTGDTIPFNRNHFGAIISNCVFEHIPNIKKSVEEMHRVLKKNGLLMTTVMCSSWNNNLLGEKLFGDAYVRWFNKIQHHDSLLSKNEWAGLFKVAGFEVIESTDYLYEKAAKKIEIYHYLSLPSLLTYILFKRWNIFSLASQEKVKEIKTLFENDDKSPSACFFMLRKIT